MRIQERVYLGGYFMTDDEEKIIMLMKFHETFKKHENAEPVKNFVSFNKRYHPLSEEFIKFLHERMERIEQTYGADIEKLTKILKEKGDLEEETYNKILEEELKRDVSKEVEFLEAFTKFYAELLKVKKEIIKYIKNKNLDDDFKGIVLKSLNGDKKECEIFIILLKNMVKKHHN